MSKSLLKSILPESGLHPLTVHKPHASIQATRLGNLVNSGHQQSLGAWFRGGQNKVAGAIDGIAPVPSRIFVHLGRKIGFFRSEWIVINLKHRRFNWNHDDALNICFVAFPDGEPRTLRLEML